MSGSEDDDEVPQLSSQALAALTEFYNEQKDEERKLELAMEEGAVNDITVQEDWQLSQFWYDDDTAVKLATEAITAAGENGSIACISCPTAYKKIRELKPSTCAAKCLEFDKRFAIYEEDFVFYDYNDPVNLPKEWRETFTVVVADPPFLSEDCLCKTAMTIKYLAKDKLILCTGAIMEELTGRLLQAKPCKFRPKHVKGLQNEFMCYTNYESEAFSQEES